MQLHRIRRGFAAFSALLLWLPALAWSHGLSYEIGAGEAVVVTLGFPAGEQPLFEPYELFRPEQPLPFQVGRTDAAGRVSFVPDQPGRWRLRLSMEDGHGLELGIEIDSAGGIEQVHGPGLSRLAASAAGAGYLLGLGGLLLFWRQRRKRGCTSPTG